MRKPLNKYWVVLGLLLIGTLGVGAFRDRQQTTQSNNAGDTTCAQLANSIEVSGCYAKQLAARTKTASAIDLLNEARKLQQTRTVIDCHLIAHAIGNAVLAKHRGDIGSSFLECNHNCVDGCFHGVMESTISNQRDTGQDITAFAAEACTPFTEPVTRRQCVHGLGHGIMGHSGLTLAEATDTCVHIFATTGMEACTSGILMEYTNEKLYAAQSDLHSVVPKICDEADTVDKAGKPGFFPACANALGQGLMLFTGYNLEQSLALCNTLPQTQAVVCAWSANQENLDHQLDS